MTRDLSRLFNPRSVAVIGGGAWCRSVVAQLRKTGFEGQVWPVHPTAPEIGGHAAVTTLAALPHAPDAAFIGVNRNATIEVAAELNAMKAGGAVCFASGFAEVDDGTDLTAALLEGAGEMPILGPNCYGFINALDGIALWPDQHGCVPVETGVAILTQSSNIAINLTMQQRGLPIACVVTCGNQQQTSQADIALALLDDPRITAIGLHIEGFRDLDAWHRLALAAHARGVPLVALKVGRSAEAQTAAVSHTASLAGEDTAADALLRRFGIPRADDLSRFIEALKILHLAGPLASKAIATISCSGGEASLAADLALDAGLHFPPLRDEQIERLSAVLGPRVALANPLDYHTYIWRDVQAMTKAFSAMSDPDLAMILLIVDFPRGDRCDPADWECAIVAAVAAASQIDQPIAMVSTLPELLPEAVALRLMAGGVIPLNGLPDALHAVAIASAQRPPDPTPPLAPPIPLNPQTLTEAAAKSALATFGLHIPRANTARTPQSAAMAARRMQPPLAVKGLGFAHKTEHAAVTLDLQTAQQVHDAAASMQAAGYLVEEMVTDPVIEMLVGVTRDPAHGILMTIGAGGILAEILDDTASCLLPATEDTFIESLNRLKCVEILAGYRGRPGIDVDALLRALTAIQDYVLANITTIVEVEINPLICTATSAVAVDALIRKANDTAD